MTGHLGQRCLLAPHALLPVLDAGEPEATAAVRGDQAVKTTGPSSVTAMVCSLWAALAPLAVRSVQPSGPVTYPSVPSEISMGSMAITRPGRSR